MIAQALRDRLELGESDIDLDNRRISRDCRPQCSASVCRADWRSTAAQGWPDCRILSRTRCRPRRPSFGGAVRNAFNNTRP